MLRVCLAVVALVAAGCGVDLPNTPTPVRPTAGVATMIELSATAGLGANGGQAVVHARVLDAYFTLLQNVDVTFQTDAGTLAPTVAGTNANGIAETVLTAPAGTAHIIAAAGSVRTDKFSVTIQPPR